MQPRKITSYILVIIQFSCVKIIGLSKPYFANNLILLIIEFSGIFLGIWSILAMNINNLSILPDLKKMQNLLFQGLIKLLGTPCIWQFSSHLYL